MQKDDGFVSSMLHSLVEAVLNYEPSHISDTGPFSVPQRNHSFLDLGSYETEFSGRKISVVDCYKQHSENFCGFHCFFNLTEFLKNFLKSREDLEKEICNGVIYWKTYYAILSYLLKNYPNKTDVKYLQNDGPLDRSHMEYLIKECNTLRTIKLALKQQSNFNVFCHPFYYGFGVIQSSGEDLECIENWAEDLKNQERAIGLFPLGTTIHWRINLNYIFNDEIDKALQEWNEGGQEKNEKEVKRQKSWIKDLRKTINILINVIERKKTFAEYLIENQIDETVDHCNQYVKGEDFKGYDSKALSKFYNWFDDEFRPQVINHDLLQPLSKMENVSGYHLQKLRNFYQDCISFSQNIKKEQNVSYDPQLLQDIDTFISRFSTVLEKFK